jgi:hypothetical protein
MIHQAERVAPCSKPSCTRPSDSQPLVGRDHIGKSTLVDLFAELVGEGDDLGRDEGAQVDRERVQGHEYHVCHVAAWAGEEGRAGSTGW